MLPIVIVALGQDLSSGSPRKRLSRSCSSACGSTAATYLQREKLPFTEVEKIEDAYALMDRDVAQAMVYDALYAKWFGRAR